MTRCIVGSVDLTELAREMSELMNVSVPKSARINLDLALHLPAFEGDSAQIREVMMNLVANAADALGEQRGTITLRTSLINADRDVLSSMYVDDDLVPGRYLCLQVSDTGAGM